MKDFTFTISGTPAHGALANVIASAVTPGLGSSRIRTAPSIRNSRPVVARTVSVRLARIVAVGTSIGPTSTATTNTATRLPSATSSFFMPKPPVMSRPARRAQNSE